MDHGSHGLLLMLKFQLVFQAATRTLTSDGFGGWLLGSRIFVDSTGPQFSSVFVLSDDITLKNDDPLDPKAMKAEGFQIFKALKMWVITSNL